MQFDPKNTTSSKKQDKKGKYANNDLINYNPIKYQQYDSIKVINQKGHKLFEETDYQFVQSIQNVSKSRTNMLKRLVSGSNSHLDQEECEQVHHLGLLHRKANKINRNSNLTKNDLKNREELRSLYCHCGCQRVAGQNYPICHDIQELSFMGSGILLFFNLLKGIFISFMLMVVIYGFYAIAKNYGGEDYLTASPSHTCDSSYCQFKDRVSRYNLTDVNYVTDVLNWMGLGSMIFWILIGRFLKYYCFYKDELIDQNLKSSADYAVKIDNLPNGEYNQEDLYEFLEQVYERKITMLENTQTNQVLQAVLQGNQPQVIPQESIIQNNGSLIEEQPSKRVMKELMGKFQNVVENKINRENHFNIKSIQIIYRMDFCRKIIQKIVEKCIALNRLINVQDGKFFITDKDTYMDMKKNTIEIYQTLADMRKKFLNDGSFRKKIATRSAIIQFYDQDNKKLLLDNFGSKNLTFFKRIKQRFHQWISGTSTLIFKGVIPSITRAPEPSDILWQNCEKEFSFFRLFGIFCATTLVILISLGAIAGLQALQFYLKDHKSTESEQNSSLRIFNFMTSIVLIIINAVLWVLLKFLLQYEYNHTYTQKIISQMNKSSPATWINTIIIPIVVNYVFYDRYYGADGVAGIVFDYQVTALAVSLPLMVLNPVQLIVALILKFKCLRNYLIRSRYQKKVEQEEEVQKIMMEKIYKFYSSPQFVIEQAYNFILSNVMHALFFCQLQPFILVLVALQIFLFYWACKLRVLRMCKMPALIDNLVFEVAINETMLSPIFYGVGSIFNSYVSSKLNPDISFNFVASSICVGIGVLNYLNPGDFSQKLIEKITDCFDCLKKENVFKDLQKKREEQRKLQENRQKVYQRLKQSSKQKQEPSQLLSDILIFKGSQEVIQEEVNESAVENVRLQNYYRNSNCLTLLGFQRAIFGQSSTKEIELQFKKFCESHIQRTTVELFDQHSQYENEDKEVQKYEQIEIQHQPSGAIME